MVRLAQLSELGRKYALARTQKPEAGYQDLYAWFWRATALGGLLRSVRDRLKSSGEPALDQLAFGISR